MIIIFFFSNGLKLDADSRNKTKNSEKIFVSQLIAFELGVADSRNIEQDICQRQSICQQTPLRFHLTLAETFSKSTFLRMMKKLDKGTAMEVLQVFGTLSHVDCKSVFRNGAFYRVVYRSFAQSAISETH